MGQPDLTPETRRQAFGHLVSRYSAERGVSLAWVASMLSHPPHGQIWTGTEVGRLQRGKRSVTVELVDHLISILGMDPDEAYETLGWWPKDLTRQELRQLRQRHADYEAWVAAGRPELREAS
jgi:hypothetical protein